jgi:hypothetical protein
LTKVIECTEFFICSSTAATFLFPGLNVTWLSQYDSANSPSGEAADAPGVIPTQLLPQLDIGELVGVNASSPLFKAASSLTGLPFLAGSGLGLLGLLGMKQTFTFLIKKLGSNC